MSRYPLLEELSGLMAGPDAALLNETLAPDGKYQTRPVTLRQMNGEVIERLGRSLASRSAADLPILFCSWGKCRVGSTALTNLFGLAGVKAFYQPVKTMMRHRLVGSEPHAWQPPQVGVEAHIYSKEMAGPYLAVETIFNPLEMLVASGYPAERLRLVLVDRDPFASLSSWVSKWPDRVPRDRLVEHFVLSSLQARRMKSYATANGIAITHYVYEASRKPMEAIRALFARLEIAELFHNGVVQDWNERGALDSHDSGIVFPQEPDVYVVPGLHSSEKQYSYKGRDTGNLTAEERDVVREYDLLSLYRENVEGCIADLHFDAKTAADMFPEVFASR